MLEGSEFRTLEEVETGEEALRAARRLRPNLVMLEIRTPTGDGLNVIEALKAEHPGTAVVIVTTYDNPIYLAGAIAAGAAAYLTDMVAQRLKAPRARAAVGSTHLP